MQGGFPGEAGACPGVGGRIALHSALATLLCVCGCPREKSENSGNWKTPPQSCSSPNCNTTLKTLMGSEEDFTPVEV